MKKLNDLSESDFLKLFFAFLTAAFLIAAACMPDRQYAFDGFIAILSQPAKISTNFFAVGGYAGTFLNMGLVALICLWLFVALKATANNVSTFAFLLTLGFSAWGITVLNMLPTMLGVVIYCGIKKESVASNVNAMLFSTGIAPLITDLMLRYPNAEAVGYTPAGIALGIGVGIVIGFFLPAGLPYAPKVHKGFDLYSAAVPVGMTAFFLQAVLYKTMGVALPAAPDASTLQIADSVISNVFCGTVFALCILWALLMGCSPAEYWQFLKNPDPVKSTSGAFGKGVFLMNAGVYGLFILGYYNLIGATFNSVTFGIIFCMLCCCNSGSHPGTVWPLMVGYAVASWLFGWISTQVGGNFAGALNAQAIAVGLCFCNGLSPISAKYGWQYGVLAAAMHYVLVTSVPNLHGGFCLYNGGFTAAFICLLLIPILERFTKTKEERLAQTN